MTMVHSAYKRTEGDGVKFDPGGVRWARDGRDTTVFNYEGGQYKRVQGDILEANTCAAPAQRAHDPPPGRA